MNAQALKKQQKNKDALIKKSIKTLKKKDIECHECAEAFVSRFLSQIPADDIINWKADELSSIAKSMLDWACDREVNKARLRVFNPEEGDAGWNDNRTVIEIVNDDMPFLIDSIAAELNHRNEAIEVLIHPILKVSRNKKGHLTSVDGSGKPEVDGLFESYIHIQIESTLSEKRCKEMQDALEIVVMDVRNATQDWHPMLSRLDSVIQEMSHIPADNDPEVINEARSFLQYVHDNNFTLLGYRKDNIRKTKSGEAFAKAKGSGLGLLKDSRDIMSIADQGDLDLQGLIDCVSPVMISKLIGRRSTVHRRVPYDVILVKILDSNNKLIGRHVFIGLFTSSTYSCRTSEVPIIRRKVQETISRASFGHDSHDYKALEHILEKFPRDELFQIDVDRLVNTALGILRLQERQRIALFARLDKLGNYFSCLVYVPRDHFDSQFRRKVAGILEESLDGHTTNFYTTLDDSPLARILFTIKLNGNAKNKYDIPAIEQKLIDAGRGWHDSLKSFLMQRRGKHEGLVLFEKYQYAFSRGYQDNVDPSNVINDIRHVEDVLEGKDITVEFYQLNDAPENEYRLKVYHKDTPVPLSDILPILERMGLRINSELPYEIHPEGADTSVWIHDFFAELPDQKNIDLDVAKPLFEDAFLNIWDKRAENDGLNQLILKGGLDWRGVNIVRTYLSYLRQAKFPYSRRYVETVMNLYPEITGEIIDLFLMRSNPDQEKDIDKKIQNKHDALIKKLESISQLDHDRILRSLVHLVEATLRTNYFQRNEDGSEKTWLSVKLNSRMLEFIPKPKPYVEIFIYSTRVEAVHLRGGPIARGGIRWSDRHDDFRTEVLGLVKAQMVKNAVIVPVGAKGGFVVKNPPKTGGRQAFLDEGIACYKILIQGLLDLTDNNVNGKIIKPENTVCYDGDDPYLVVAADKGTATFSDIANSLSVKEDFWLDDAFASGGSAGYDHKEMGITAKGAWESVKRHFRELGKDIQKEDFTCLGVGDMGGDVFGNGMLLSKHTRLLGAFNHLHIFCDPNPDAAKTFKERKRLFEARGGWDQYDQKLLSKGGRIFERSAKKVKLTKEIQKCFNIDEKELAPSELIHKMLQADVELLFFGGIGTYVKSSGESHADADDRANDSLRVNGRELNAKVIGEGANLGMTQKGRIEFAERGGKLNTDFIDNSAGVDCSDHEVNIKILLRDVMKNSKMTVAARNKLLVKMTDQVSNLVLNDNYQQTQAISMCQYDALDQMGRYIAYIRKLEKENILDRRVEDLPDDETLEKMINAGEVLTRPEFAVVLSYSKIQLYQELLTSKLPGEPGSDKWLFEYFPDDVQKFKKQIEQHKLRDEIIATNVANTLINRMGPVFVMSRMEKTGATAANVARAFITSVESFATRELWDEIEKLDNKVDAITQMDALHEVFNLVKRAVTWMLRSENKDIKTQQFIDQLKPGVEILNKSLKDVVPQHIAHNISLREEAFKRQGIPTPLAKKLSRLRVLISSCDILNISKTCKSDIPDIAKVYFKVGRRLQIDLLRDAIRQVKPDNHWEARVLGALNDDLYIYQAKVTEHIIRSYGCPTDKAESGLEDWAAEHRKEIEALDQLLDEIWHAPVQNSAMLALAGQKLKYLAG